MFLCQALPPTERIDLQFLSYQTLLTEQSMMVQAVLFVLRRTQVCFSRKVILCGRQLTYYFIAWELTAFQWLSGTPVENLTSSGGSLSLSDIPAPDPSTSEDCLFLDVEVPQSIYDAQTTVSKRFQRRADSGTGGEFLGTQYISDD